jgi:multidrug efflux pump subunit AcrA (membrane-fusion protein)
MVLKYVIPVLAAAMLALAVVHVVRTHPTQPTASPPLPPPEAPFPRALAATGVVEARGGNVAVAAPAPGVVAEVMAEAGRPVAAGAPLFRLDDRSLRAELRAREARLATARAQLARLERLPRPEEVQASAARVGQARAVVAAQQAQLERGQRLLQDRQFTSEDLERLRQAVVAAQEELNRAQAEDRQLRAGAWDADLAVGRAAVAEAQALVDQANAEIGRLTVRSPAAAVVLQVNVRAGETAGGRPPVVLGAAPPLQLRVELDEQQLARFRPRAPARALPRGSTRPELPLRFIRVEPLIVPKAALTGDPSERSDARVLQVLYEFDPGAEPVYVGQQMDVFIEREPAPEPAP